MSTINICLPATSNYHSAVDLDVLYQAAIEAARDRVANHNIFIIFSDLAAGHDTYEIMSSTTAEINLDNDLFSLVEIIENCLDQLLAPIDNDTLIQALAKPQKKMKII